MAASKAGTRQASQVLQSAVDKGRATDFSKIAYSAYEQKLDFETVLDIQSPCKTDNSAMKGIQRTIKNLQNEIGRIKRFSNVNSAFDALTNEDKEPWKSIKKVVNLASTDIAGYVKNILGGVRGWVMNTIQSEVKKRLPFLFPGEMPSFLDGLGKGMNAISCAFAKVVRGLAKTVGNLLFQLLDKYINGPMCLAENFVVDLLNSILDPIIDAIGSTISLINGVLSQVQNLANSLLNALDFVTGILNFFKCDDDKKCPSFNEISLSGAGQNNNEGGDLVAPNVYTAFSSPSDEKTPISGSYTSGISNGKSSMAQDVRVTYGSNINLA